MNPGTDGRSSISFDGDLAIHFSSGLEIRVPNDQYIVPFVDINRNGSRYFNTSRREFLFNGLSDQPATLGRYFLTSAYLMVNHDVGSFTLWKANPTNSSTLVSVASNAAAQGCAVPSSAVPVRCGPFRR